ncbi:MAG: sigma-54-dependent Fis family transcriptional regulator [Leptospiraceae bacterium]|nr:sigma-54-dependent Fis family transcriptional regulator [Leptospiraceae bacterium]
MIRILLVEDDPSQRSALEEYLSSLADDMQVIAAASGAEARKALEEQEFSLIVSDLFLPDDTGLDLLKEVRQTSEVAFLILTGQPTIETAVEAIKAGASDFLTKPVDLTLLKKKVESLLETVSLKEENRRLRARLADTFSTSSVIGNAPALKQVLERVSQVAPTDVTVLLEGESGTGKEKIANLIHENSRRSDRSFVKVNCGALTKSILESELFGVVRGAFTGADRDRAGLFEAAQGGTIFLDEIGEMDLESQVRLLRVIEEREVMRVGSTRAVPIDVRIIAATNRDLLDQVDSGEFREDLYYRLAVIRLELPPLRDRKEDIPLLFNYFVTDFNERYMKSVTRLAPELLQFFQNYDWPGNIRQFRNVLEGMVVMATEDTLELKDLPDNISRTPRRKDVGEEIKPGITMDEYEKAIIRKNLGHFGGNREQTAKALGISERTLYRKIKEYSL